MNRDQIAVFLSKYIPEAAVEQTIPLIESEPLQLRVTRGRKTKFGDYRPPYGEKGHRLSVNADLNPYAFLLTLIHELAHYQVQIRYGRKVKPHGREWKNTFRELMVPFLNTEVFPDDILRKLRDYMTNPKASTCSDPVLFKTLNQYNPNPAVYLQDIKPGAVFVMGKRVFKKLEKQRSRYKCMELPAKRLVLINGIAEVEQIQEKK